MYHFVYPFVWLVRALDASTENSIFMREVSMKLGKSKCLLLNLYISKPLVSFHAFVVGPRDVVMLLRNGISFELLILKLVCHATFPICILCWESRFCYFKNF